MPFMRKSGGVEASFMAKSRGGDAAGARSVGSIMRLPARLLVFLGLPHDFLGGEVDAAGREGIADEEIVGLVRIVVLALLEVGILDDGERQLDRLRHDFAFERR